MKVPEIHPHVVQVAFRDMGLPDEINEQAFGELKERIWHDNPEVGSLISCMSSKCSHHKTRERLVYTALMVYRLIECQMEVNELETP